MSLKSLSLVSIMLMSGLCSAAITEVYVRDYNTLQPIQNVNISIYNTTEEHTTLSDQYGRGELSTSTGDWQFRAWRSSYATYDSVINVTNDSTREVFLYPQSTSGIIRLRFSDLTLNPFPQDRQLCIYFASNDRLVGCYFMNETVTIHTNMAYKFYPMITKTDIVTTPSGLANLLDMFLGNIFSVLVTLLIIAGLLIWIWRRSRK